MTRQPFQGAGTALVTPFLDDGGIDEAALRRLVDLQIEGGIDMIFPCGTTGEGVTLDGEETDRVLRIVLEQANGRAQVIPGAGSNATAKAVSGAERARRLGAAGVLSVGPYYNKPTQDGYYEHFKAVAGAGLPVVVYNVPSRTASNIEPETLLRLAEIPNIVAVKESSGSLQQVMQLLRDRPAGFRVLAGDDYMALPVLALGGDGVVSVLSNEVPGRMSALVNAAMDCDFQGARALHYELLALMNANFMETNPIPVKAALAMMGLVRENYRLPLVPMTRARREKLQKIMEGMGLIQSQGVHR